MYNATPAVLRQYNVILVVHGMVDAPPPNILNYDWNDGLLTIHSDN